MSLKQKTVSGFIWTSAGMLGNGFVSFLVTMILARILLPYDFALVELLLIFLAISNVIVDSGFSQAIIRDENPSETDLSSVFYFNIALSFTLYILLFFAAPYLSDYFEAPELTLLSRVVFLVIIFNSFSLIQNATLNRSLNFSAVNKSSVIGSFLAGGISIIMAFTGFGIWALVANMVLLPFFRSIVLWYHSNWRPKKSFSIKSVKRYFAFGGFLMLQGVIDAISSNIISIFIGKIYTKNDLGFFSQGRKFDGYIVSPFSSIIKKVTYPILSKIKNEESRLKEGYRQIVGVIMFVYIPIMLFVIATSENMVITLFGEKWFGSAIYLRIFAIGGLLIPLQNICANVVYVKGKSKLIFIYSTITQVIRIILIVLFIKQGVISLSIAYVVSGIIGSFLYIYLGMKLLDYNLKELFNDLYFPIIVSGISVFVVFLIGLFFSHINIIMLFSFQIVAMFIFYFFIMKTTKYKYYYEVKNQFFSLIKKTTKFSDKSIS